MYAYICLLLFAVLSTEYTQKANATTSPSVRPTISPTSRTPTLSPTSRMPTLSPTSRRPTLSPTIRRPTLSPTTSMPSPTPTANPTNPTGRPSSQPSMQPSSQPRSVPSGVPSAIPTSLPTTQPHAAVPPLPSLLMQILTMSWDGAVLSAYIGSSFAGVVLFLAFSGRTNEMITIVVSILDVIGDCLFIYQLFINLYYFQDLLRDNDDIRKDYEIDESEVAQKVTVTYTVAIFSLLFVILLMCTNIFVIISTGKLRFHFLDVFPWPGVSFPPQDPLIMAVEEFRTAFYTHDGVHLYSLLRFGEKVKERRLFYYLVYFCQLTYNLLMSYLSTPLNLALVWLQGIIELHRAQYDVYTAKYSLFQEIHDKRPWLSKFSFLQWWLSCNVENYGRFRAACWPMGVPLHFLLIVAVNCCLYFYYVARSVFDGFHRLSRCTSACLYLMLLIFLNAVRYLLYLAFFFAFVAYTNSAVFVSCMACSDANYYYYGSPGKDGNYHFQVSSIGIFIEDGPQLVLQAFYAIYMAVRFDQAPSGFQYFSLSLSLWQVIASLTLKCFVKHSLTESADMENSQYAVLTKGTMPFHEVLQILIEYLCCMRFEPYKPVASNGRNNVADLGDVEVVITENSAVV